MNDDNEEAETVRLRVAEKLGWRAMEYSRDGVLVGHPPGRKDIRAVPSYARDIKAAWEIVEFLASQNTRFSLINEAPHSYIRNYFVKIGENPQSLVSAAHGKAPMAICLAFLELKSSLK